MKQQREKYRQRLLSAFDSHYHPDHSVPRYGYDPLFIEYNSHSVIVVSSRRLSLRVDSAHFARSKLSEAGFLRFFRITLKLPTSGLRKRITQPFMSFFQKKRKNIPFF